MRTDIEARSGGLLLGMAAADGWSFGTKVALCVADAAATGLDLDAGGGLQLLRRNLDELRRDCAGAVFASRDVFLAATAVVAVTYRNDTADERAEAIRVVVNAVHPRAIVDDDLYRWGELMADTVRTGTMPSWASGPIVDAATSGTAWLPDLASTTPAAYGALFGVVRGWSAVPELRVGQGWPGADASALIGLGVLVSRSRPADPRPADERNGGTVPVESWDEWVPTDASAALAPAAGDFAWRRSQIVLTTADAETR